MFGWIQWILDYAVSATPTQNRTRYFRIVEDDPVGPAAQLFVDVSSTAESFRSSYEPWTNRTSYSNVMTDMRTADAADIQLLDSTIVRDYTFNARANEIYAECAISNMDLRRDIGINNSRLITHLCRQEYGSKTRPSSHFP